MNVYESQVNHECHISCDKKCFLSLELNGDSRQFIVVDKSSVSNECPGQADKLVTYTTSQNIYHSQVVNKHKKTKFLFDFYCLVGA